jgi:hypothetical protein
MTREDDLIGQLEGYLEEYEGVTPLPDAVRTAVRAKLPATRQLRPIGGLLGRFPTMNNNAVRFGLAAAVVLLVTLLGISFLPGNTGDDANPTPVATSTPIPSQDRTAAGTYTINPLPTPNRAFSVTYTQPDGWSVLRLRCLVPATGQLGPAGMGICFSSPRILYSDPCQADRGTEWVVEIGPTVDDLANALAAQTVYEATNPTDVTLSGYSGKRMDLQLPDVGFPLCEGGQFVPWEGSIGAQGPGNRWHLWILDVDGLRVVIVAHDFQGTPTQDQEELYAIVDSFRIHDFGHGWPSGRENPPGRYSFGSPENPNVGRYGWMHNGYQTLDEGQGVEMEFGYTSAPDPAATTVLVAGYPGTYEELIHQNGSRTEYWTMEIEGRTLLITIRAEPNTTAAQLAEAHAIIESIRYEPTETGSFRVTFTLPFGWDSG